MWILIEYTKWCVLSIDNAAEPDRYRRSRIANYSRKNNISQHKAFWTYSINSLEINQTLVNNKAVCKPLVTSILRRNLDRELRKDYKYVVSKWGFMSVENENYYQQYTIKDLTTNQRLFSRFWLTDFSLNCYNGENYLAPKTLFQDNLILATQQRYFVLSQNHRINWFFYCSPSNRHK